jgi:hypothetical protein
MAIMKPPAANGYATLVKHIRRELQELDLIVKRRTAESYWQIGKFIHTHLLASRQRAEHGSAFYERLSKDVERDATTLSRTVQFYRAYPILAAPQELTWEHYKSLITIKDAKERKQLEERIVRNDWDIRKLRKYLSVQHGPAALANDGKSIANLTFTRGRLDTFGLVEPDTSWGIIKCVINVASEHGGPHYEVAVSY